MEKHWQVEGNGGGAVWGVRCGVYDVVISQLRLSATSGEERCGDVEQGCLGGLIAFIVV